MFTGLIERTAEIGNIEEIPGGIRLELLLATDAFDLNIGDSVCVSGVCLTAVSLFPERVYFDLSPETLAVTHFSEMQIGAIVNVERSLRVGDRLGGHFVSGHVDGICELVAINEDGGFFEYSFEVPRPLLPLLVKKGSVAIDGVSLTVAKIDDSTGVIVVALIPETLKRTNLSRLRLGSVAHIEADLLAKHIQRVVSSNLV